MSLSSEMNNCTSIWISTGWILWLFSALAVFVQMMGSTTQPEGLRYLEEGADEDDRYTNDDNNMAADDDAEWYNLDTWLDPSSLAYDIIEGFLYVADAFFIAWVLWGCLVHCGIFPDDRLDRNRRGRRIKDGRGVFAPLRDFDALESDNDDDDDDDESRNSMEYGDARDEEEYADIDLRREEEKMAKAAKAFFSKAEKHKKQKEKRKHAPGPAEEEVLLLDLEMTATPSEQSGPDVIFL
jgi:hypothetical protein